MRRVDATLRDSRKIVAISSTEGNAEKSRELSVNNATKRMRTPVVMLNASNRSRIIRGKGTTIIRRIDITPAARTISDFFTILFKGILVVANGHPLPRGLIISIYKFTFWICLLQIMLQKSNLLNYIFIICVRSVILWLEKISFLTFF